MTARDESAVAHKRRATGRDFEVALDLTHQEYELRRFAKIRRNHVPTKIVGRGALKKRIATHGAHVDRTGWVSVNLTDGIPARAHSGGSKIFPVAFDAKVLGLSHATYKHDVGQQHQLHDLRDAAAAGEVAFLLVYAPKVSRVFGLEIGANFTALLGGGVLLWDNSGRERRMLYPSIEVSESPGGILKVDWIAMLPALIAEARFAADPAQRHRNAPKAGP